MGEDFTGDGSDVILHGDMGLAESFVTGCPACGMPVLAFHFTKEYELKSSRSTSHAFTSSQDAPGKRPA